MGDKSKSSHTTQPSTSDPKGNEKRVREDLQISEGWTVRESRGPSLGAIRDVEDADSKTPDQSSEEISTPPNTSAPDTTSPPDNSK